MLPLPPTPRWRWRHLLLAPLRLPFALASALWALLALAWWAEQAGWRAPAPVPHGLLLGLGPLPPFIAGFAATVRPRWLALPAPSARSLALPAALHGLGTVAAVAGLGGGRAGLAAMAVATGWWALDHTRACRHSAATDRLHAWGVAACLWAMAAALLGAATGPATDWTAWARSAWWGALLPCFMVALHRMSALLRGLLPPLLAALLLRAAWAWSGGPAAWRWATAVAMAMAAATLLGAALDRHRRPARHNRVTGWLQVALAWGALGLGTDALALCLDASWLALAALHALALGFAGTLWLTLGDRAGAASLGRVQAVTLGEFGQLLALQAVALLRLLAAWPPAAPVLLPLSAAALALLALHWMRHWWPALGRATPGRAVTARPCGD